MPRPIRATIDLSALQNNLRVVRHHAPNSKVWSVIKANAYGHGLLRVAQALDSSDGFALLELNDAIELREHGYRHPILLLEGFFCEEDLLLIAEYGLTPVIHSTEQIHWLSQAALPTRIPVYLKINTGMNRLGFSLQAFPEVFVWLQSSQLVSQITLMTHFPNAETSMGVSEEQERFDQATAGIKLPSSLANSAALLRYPQTHRDWVRPGIILYGSSPFTDETALKIGLQPVMTLTSEIIAVQDLVPGQGIGYGLLFRADKAMRIGIVACGYADGYPRHAPTGTPILVEKQRTRVLGRVSMDMLAVDLSAIPGAHVGSPVTLWGKGLSADEVAQAAGTVSYQLFCNLGQRVLVEEIG